MSNGTGDGSRVIKSVETNLQIVEEIRRQHGAKIADIAAALGISPSTVHHHLATLQQQGYIQKNGDEYQLSVRFLSLGGDAIRTNEFLASGTQPVNELAKDTDLTAQLSVEENGYIVCIYESHVEETSQSIVRIGKQIESWNSAIGKATLSALPDERRTAVLTKMDGTSPDEEALEDEMAAVHEQGVAFDDTNGDTDAIATPVTSINGELLGVISLTGPQEKIDEQADELAQRVNTTAEVLKINSTYDTWMSTE